MLTAWSATQRVLSGLGQLATLRAARRPHTWLLRVELIDPDGVVRDFEETPIESEHPHEVRGRYVASIDRVPTLIDFAATVWRRQIPGRVSHAARAST